VSAPLVAIAAGYGAAPPESRSYPYPPAETPIVALVRKEIALAPGDVFRGRAATFTGLRIEEPIDWFALHAIDTSLVRQVGNDHRMVGLWYFDIPTLFEYSQFISPAFYALTKSGLARQDDRQMRTVMTLRRVEPRLLRMLGVRHLITDAPVEAPARLRLSVGTDADAELYLYELDDVNVGDYSPTRQRRYVRARDMLAALSGPGFAPRAEVVTDIELPSELVGASAARLSVGKGFFRVSARSPGRSVLVLPLEYSHCLKLESAEPTAQARLFRANLLLTGILFSGTLEATLTYFAGPFRNPGCRIEDARDMETLDIKAASSVYGRPAPYLPRRLAH
jgi:hypothetical protein